MFPSRVEHWRTHATLGLRTGFKERHMLALIKRRNKGIMYLWPSLSKCVVEATVLGGCTRTRKATRRSTQGPCLRCTFPAVIIPNLSKLLDFGCLVRSSSLFFRGAQDLKKIISPVDLYNDLLELTKMLLLGAAKNIMICYN